MVTGQWPDLREQFVILASTSGGLVFAELSELVGAPTEWVIRGPRAKAERFMVFAGAASQALSPSGVGTGWQVWLDRIRSAGLARRQLVGVANRARRPSRQIEEWIIDDVCASSAELCTLVACGLTFPTREVEPVPAPEQPPLDNRNLVDQYLQKLSAKTGGRVTRKMIWSRFYDDPTEFQRWQRCDPRTTPRARKLFDDLFSKEPDPSCGLVRVL